MSNYIKEKRAQAQAHGDVKQFTKADIEFINYCLEGQADELDEVFDAIVGTVTNKLVTKAPKPVYKLGSYDGVTARGTASN